MKKLIIGLRLLKCISLFWIICIVATPTAFADTTWDVATDFSATSNPNGVWSYGWFASGASPGGTLTLYNTNIFNAPYGYLWYDINKMQGGDVPAVWKNTNGPAIDGVAQGEVSLHPGAFGAYSVVQWTAPSAGTFSFNGSFDQGDIGAMSYYINDGSLNLYTMINDSNTYDFSFTRTLFQGEVIDFIVGVNTSAGYYYGNTPLDLTVNAVPTPEPCTILLLGSGLVGLAAYRKRFKKA